MAPKMLLPAMASLLAIASAAPAHQKRDGVGSVVTSPTGLTWYDSNLADGTTGLSDPSTYTCFSGPATNFPSIDQWINFNDMWNNAVGFALTPIGDTPDEIQDMHDAITNVSVNAQVDARVILAVILDESTGNVNVACTTSFGGVNNCGLMQSYNGVSFDPNDPAGSITQMVVDGTQGTASGPGLVQWINDDPDVSADSTGNIYEALRGYNSGSIDPSDLSSGGGATNAYVSNVANYLLGWNSAGSGPSGCGL